MVQDDVSSQFQKKLRELFRCDDSEFNWGVYRILNQRNEDIDDFIKKDIPKVIDEKIQVLNEKSLEQIEDEMKEMEQKARDLDVEVQEIILHIHTRNVLLSSVPLSSSYLNSVSRSMKDFNRSVCLNSMFSSESSYCSRY